MQCPTLVEHIFTRENINKDLDRIFFIFEYA